MQPAWFADFLHVLQEAIDILDAKTRDNALPADPPLQLVAQILQQRNLAVAARGEVAVATLRRYRPVLLSIPDQQRLAQPRTRRDQPAMALRIGVPGVQAEYLVGRQLRNSVPIRLEIVDQKKMPDRKRPG